MMRHIAFTFTGNTTEGVEQVGKKNTYTLKSKCARRQLPYKLPRGNIELECRARSVAHLPLDPR